MYQKNTKILAIIAVVVILVLGGIWFVVFKNSQDKKPDSTPIVEIQKVTTPIHKVIGKTVEGRDIDLYTYGTGKTHLAFVGGIHGGYEWNSVLLAYQFMDYLEANPEIVSENLIIDVIPSANPDGVYKVTGKVGRFTEKSVSTNQKVLESGRFNADDVDLNRNFDCKWNPKSTWRSKEVSGGTTAFSEPEAKAIKSYVSESKPSAVVFWHSQSNAVYASQCEDGILPETLNIMNMYAKASGYPAIKTFDAYATTGAADDWLASIGIPAITVELSTHESVEWNKNILGIKALLEHFR